MKEITSQNKFAVLSNPEEQPVVLQEGEVQQYQGLIREEISATQDLGSPAGGSSPTYAEMEKNKPMDNSESFKKNLWKGTLKKGEHLSRRFERKKLNV